MMSSLVGDSGGSSRYATKLRNAAGAIDDAQRGLRNARSRSLSQGSFVARIDRTIRSGMGRSDRVERDLRTLSSVVSSHSAWVIETENELRNLETRIRNWVAQHPVSVDPAAVGPDASLVTYWPSHLSFEWRDLAARLRAHGAWF